jgi:hypothetical protein
MPKRPPFFDVVDPEGLTDADWAEINKLKRAYESGGTKALSKAMDELASDEIRYMTVMAAFYPDRVGEAIKDQMAEMGMTMEDLKELLKNLKIRREGGSGTKH